MRPNQGPLGTQYPCRCGAAHPKIMRIFNLDLLLCPAEADDTLHLATTIGTWKKVKGSPDALEQVPATVPYLVTGDASKSPMAMIASLETALEQSSRQLLDLGDRVAALEALAKRKDKAKE